MARSFLFISSVVMSLFCTRMADFASLNDDHDLAKFPQMNDIVISTVHDYLQEQEKRLAALRMCVTEFRNILHNFHDGYFFFTYTTCAKLHFRFLSSKQI